MLTKEIYAMSHQLTLLDIPSAISSQESGDGVSRSGLRDGVTTSQRGQDQPHVNPTPSLASVMVARKAKAMNGIFGRNFAASSASAALQQFLANKLQARFSGDGGMTLQWTLKPRVTPVRRLYCVLMPSGGGHERKRLYWMADASSEGRQGHQPIDSVSLAAAAALSIYGDVLARAGAALAGDYSDLLPGDGVSVAVERCAAKGYGNAIVPQVAAEFIRCAM